jgi:hypothetical protein
MFSSSRVVFRIRILIVEIIILVIFNRILLGRVVLDSRIRI